ncbi:zinc finger BED domain-containing protein 1-like [Xiphophorus hellerii]|uniref:zinc finger BED domain-containing protein 1-like n=1 Tax=Xiphophorus hellerii TaxID=8084 RepID=UPI0013B363C3|nr:zinc finger BED domain-containing protein 1-like [Xiphophorus hellerii]
MEGTGECSEGEPRKRQKMSKVWEHFRLNRKDNTAQCIHCKAELAYHNSTTSMLQHLKRKHPLHASNSYTVANSEPKSHTLDSFVQRVPGCSVVQAAEFTNSILNMIITDMRPLSVVEDEGFQKMISTFNPNYTPPSRTYFVKMMEKKYEEIKDKLKNILKETDSIALTADIWTSVATEAYLGVTCHFLGEDWKMKSHTLTTMPLEERHTAANIAEWLEEVIAKFDVPPEKVRAVIHDNGANIVAAVKILAEKHKWASVRCAGHTLNLVVQNALKSNQSISKCVAAARCLVEHFKKSELACTKLKDKQQQMGTASHMLIQDVSTRWNSTFHMLCRLLEQRWPITAALSDPALTPRGKHYLDLKPEQWNIIEEISKALQPFEEATVFLSGQDYVTLSALPQLVQSLKKSIQTQVFETAPAQSYQAEVMAQITTRWEGLFMCQPQSSNTVVLTAALDPRFKKLKFLPPDEAFKIQSMVQTMVLDVKKKMRQKNSGENEVSTDAQDKPVEHQQNTNTFFSNLLGSSESSTSDEEDEEQHLNQDVQKEVLMYFGEHTLSKRENPLLWWKSNAARYPTLSKLAKFFLCIPATSTPSERLFSAAGNIASKRRASLSSQHVDMLTFLHSNHSLL